MLEEVLPFEHTPVGLEHRLRSLSLQSAVFAPCSNVPSNGDWLAVTMRNVEGLQTVISTSGSASVGTTPSPGDDSPDLVSEPEKLRKSPLHVLP
jgi:hypothetical protein